MDSRDYYAVYYGWDVSNYFESGVRQCAIYKKHSESFTDALLVKYTDGTKRRVNGVYLYDTLDNAQIYINSKKNEDLDNINYQIIQLEIDEIKNKSMIEDLKKQQEEVVIKYDNVQYIY